MSAQMYIARLIEEGRSDRGPVGGHRHSDLRHWDQHEDARKTGPIRLGRRTRKAVQH
jgi:hypothetical protein